VDNLLVPYIKYVFPSKLDKGSWIKDQPATSRVSCEWYNSNRTCDFFCMAGHETDANIDYSIIKCVLMMDILFPGTRWNHPAPWPWFYYGKVPLSFHLRKCKTLVCKVCSESGFCSGNLNGLKNSTCVSEYIHLNLGAVFVLDHGKCPSFSTDSCKHFHLLLAFTFTDEFRKIYISWGYLTFLYIIDLYYKV